METLELTKSKKIDEDALNTAINKFIGSDEQLHVLKEQAIYNWLIHNVHGLNKQQANYIASSLVCESSLYDIVKEK